MVFKSLKKKRKKPKKECKPCNRRPFSNRTSSVISKLPEKTDIILPIPNKDGTMPDFHDTQKHTKVSTKLLKENSPKNIYDIEPSKIQNLWERLPNENERDYAAFYTYLKLGPNRTVKAVAEALGKDENNASAILSLLYNISVKYHWDERIIAYDRYMQRLEDLEVAKLRKASARKNAELLNKFESILEHEVNAFLKDIEKNSEKRILSAPQLIKMMEMLVSMKKLNEDYRKSGEQEDKTTPRKVMQIIVSSENTKKEPTNITPKNNVIDTECTKEV